MATPGREGDAELGWGVGAVAERLGVAASTLRTWERRYDVGPTRRTSGGHRRYSEVDIDRVRLTQLLIARGAPPSDAARVAHSLDGPGLAEALATSHAQTEGESGDATVVIAAMIEAARADDSRRISRLVEDALRGRGVISAWTAIVAPTLIEIGYEWSVGRLGIEAEHLASESIVAELRAHTRRLDGVDRSGPSVVLAGAEDDQHSLPVFALEAALAERDVAAHVLGAQMPPQALSAISARLQPAVIFLWASLPRSEPDPLQDVLDHFGEGTTIILGGPGWPADSSLRRGRRNVLESTDLQWTVDRISALVATDDDRPGPTIEP